MRDAMVFPNTWEEFEKEYGFIDKDERYTNGARLIPSFRVKQWLDHISKNNKQTLSLEVNGIYKHISNFDFEEVSEDI